MIMMNFKIAICSNVTNSLRLKHRNIYRFENINPLKGPATPASPPALWRVECPGDSVIFGFDGTLSAKPKPGIYSLNEAEHLYFTK